MISKIRVNSLKSIKNLTVECSKLNLFTGVNSSGKSTLLQALLLVAQNFHDRAGLNGKYVSLGEFKEIRNYYSTDTVRIELWEDGKSEPEWVEFEDVEKSGYCQVITSNDAEFDIDGSDVDDIMKMKIPLEESISKIFIKGSELHYLSCNRIGVSDIYEKNLIAAHDFGVDGKYALAFLLKNQDESVDEDAIIKDEDLSNNLLEQVNYWLMRIVGTKILIKDLKKTNYMQVNYNNNLKNNLHELYCRPVNIGAGISYLISIIITCLGAEAHSIIVIENPEIHLHPKAQSKLCEFLCFIANSGRQLFIETHSDHIFNGIRTGIATGRVEQKDVSVNFFAMNDKYETQCNPITFGDYGKIIGTNEDMDINDLFDQFEIDLGKMLAI